MKQYPPKMFLYFYDTQGVGVNFGEPAFREDNGITFFEQPKFFKAFKYHLMSIFLV